MQRSIRSNAITLAIGLTCLAVLPGAWTIAKTPASDLSIQFGNGETQRLYEARFEENFPLAIHIRHAWSALKIGLLSEPAAGAIMGKSGTLFTVEEFQAPEASINFARELSVTRSAIEALGAKLLPVIIPDKSRMLSHELPRRRSAEFERRYESLLEELGAQKLPVIDLRSALAEPGSFMVTDTHWSPQGAYRSALAISDYAIEHVASHTQFELARGPIRQFEGDLIAFADTGPWRPIVGPVSETIQTFNIEQKASENDDSLGLFDDVTIPVALVGTSFSAREDFHFADFLKVALHADLTSYALEGLGPFEPMQRFLEDKSVSENPPQIVIWEIPERYINTWSHTND